MTPRERARELLSDVMSILGPIDTSPRDSTRMRVEVQRHLESAIADALVDHYPTRDGAGLGCAYALATDICERVGKPDDQGLHSWMTGEIHKLASKAFRVWKEHYESKIQAAIAEERERCIAWMCWYWGAGQDGVTARRIREGGYPSEQSPESERAE